MAYENFYASILPGNYALTKSMELTRIRTSGTLWYTKKFLVLYYYVFLSNDIITHEYIRKVISAFDTYIDSLDPQVQDDAKHFFYPDNPAINFKSGMFKTFSSFASVTEFENQTARNIYNQNAKKLYFALLMGAGGQTGVKKKLKEFVEQPEYVYSEASFHNAIVGAVAEVCAEQFNNTHCLSDNSVKYIISQEAINEIGQLAQQETLTAARVRAIIDARTDNVNKFGAIENDLVGFIRNDRQIMYYYGYFHSKTLSGRSREFSSLTPVGELALDANSHEFLAIWEHQKVKMISQPATADIKNICPCTNAPEQFGISYTPYTDVIGHILRRGSLSLEQYKYIVSRRKHTISEDDWIAAETEIFDHTEDIKALVESFARAGDHKDEDGRKELLKYMLGIRTDLPKDAGTNSLGVTTQRPDGRFETANESQLRALYQIYFKLETYKTGKYETLFTQCEGDLRRRYLAGLNGEDPGMDPRVKINWDLYNIRPDNFILCGVMITIAALTSEIELFDGNIRQTAEALLDIANARFSPLLRKQGYRTDAAKRALIKDVLTALRNNNYTQFLTEEEEDRHQILADYREENTEALFTRIREISGRAAHATGERTRNTGLVSMLKSYYMARYTINGTLKCECCTEETFITSAGEPYLEFHHLIPFRIASGPDHYLNLFALCPNCHRKIHFLPITDREPLYTALSRNNYLQCSFVNRLRQLKEEMVLRSYHLEYLLAQNAITEEQYNSIAA